MTQAGAKQVIMLHGSRRKVAHTLDDTLRHSQVPHKGWSIERSDQPNLLNLVNP